MCLSSVVPCCTYKHICIPIYNTTCTYAYIFLYNTNAHMQTIFDPGYFLDFTWKYFARKWFGWYKDDSMTQTDGGKNPGPEANVAVPQQLNMNDKGLRV